MKITTLSQKVAQLEGKKTEVNIAQIKEVIACINKVLKQYEIDFYKVVRSL